MSTWFGFRVRIAMNEKEISVWVIGFPKSSPGLILTAVKDKQSSIRRLTVYAGWWAVLVALLIGKNVKSSVFI